MKNQKNIRKGGFRSKAQSLVEFALVLPVLLLLIFGVIEFGRLMQAYLAIENGARFALRMAVTGDYDPAFCDEAATALGLTDDDNADGAIDCRVPDTIDEYEEKNALLRDWARLPSIREESLRGAIGIAVDHDTTVTGDYLSYLTNVQTTMSSANRGNPGEPGFFSANICSNRYNPEEDFAFRLDPNPFYYDGHSGEDDYQYPIYCQSFQPSDGLVTAFIDDAGAPGNRVQIRLTYRHELITPIINTWWPTIKLFAMREGIM